MGQPADPPSGRGEASVIHGRAGTKAGPKPSPGLGPLVICQVKRDPHPSLIALLPVAT